MTIQQLRFFCEVCSQGNIAKAADKLFITSPGLSMALHRMENEAGCKLLIRTAKGVQPTKKGEFILSHAEAVLFHIKACEDFFRTTISRDDTCQVALATNIPDEFIVDLAFKFNAITSSRSVNIMQYQSSECDAIVEDGEAEIGFNTVPFDESKFEIFPIAKYPLYLLVNTAHPYAKYEKIPTSLLDKSKILIRESKTPYKTEFFMKCRHEGIEPYVAQEVGNTLTMFSIIRRDDSVFGLVPDSIVNTITMPEIKPVPFEDPDFVRTVYMYKNRNASLSATALEWIDFVLQNSKIVTDMIEQ